MSKAVTIVRGKHGKHNPYYLSRRDVAQNEELSYEALGLLNYLLSKPDTWRVKPKNLERKGCGKDKVYRLLNELIAAGHIVREQQRDARGHITAWIYAVYEEPQPLSENPELAEPELAKADIREYRKKKAPPKKASDVPEEKEEITPPNGDVPPPDTNDLSGENQTVFGDDVIIELTGSESTPLTLYPCTPANIAALIHMWWIWLPEPLRPTQRGKVIPAHKHYANTTNREYAENLVKRGVVPADFAQCLGALRHDPRFAERREPVTFCYAAAIVEDWVAEDRAESWYTPACPRITPRRPDVTVNLGEIDGLDGAALAARFAEHPDLIVDVPPLYLPAHAVTDTEDDDAWVENRDEDAALLTELNVEL